MSLKDEIRAEALRLGFSSCGFAGADYDPVLHSRFEGWIGNGFQADMKYVERSTRQRFDPRIHIPNAKSVIVCSLNYYTDPNYDAARAYISLYARGENYHKVIKDKLDALGQIIQKKTGTTNLKSFVDSSPMAEKSWATKAGLGFIGKNDLLIVIDNKNGKRISQGSFHFLGSIINDLVIKPDLIQEQTCGLCQKCIDACPTGAIGGDRLIDSNKCISYHTLSNNGTIPDEIAYAMNNNIFGCDICQSVCPYNKDLPVTSEPRFAPDPKIVNLDPAWLMDMTEDEFKKYFIKSSIGERDINILKRNFRIVADNLSHH